MLFLSATAAAERYLRRQRPAGRTYGPSVFRPVGRGQRRKEREEGEDLLTFVRPSAHRRSPSPFCGSDSLSPPQQLPSLIAPVIRSRIPERARHLLALLLSADGLNWNLDCSIPDNTLGLLRSSCFTHGGDGGEWGRRRPQRCATVGQ